MDQTPTPEGTSQSTESTSLSSSEAIEKQTNMEGQSPTLMGILAYIGPLVLIPYFLAREDSFVKFHVQQGLVLLVIAVILWVLGELMMWSFLAPFIAIINLALFVLSIIGILNVLGKKEKPLPLVGEYAHHFKV